MYKRIIIIILSLLFVFEGTSIVYARNIKQNNVQIITKKITADKKGLKLDIQYPQVKGLPNKAAENKINTAIFNRMTSAKKTAEKSSTELNADQLAKNIKVEEIFSYKVTYNKNGLINFVISDYLDAAGPHGTTERTSYIFDINTGKMLELKDLFKLGSDYKAVMNKEIKKSMVEKKLNKVLLVPFESIKTNENYYLTNSGLVIYFQLYDYFPYVYGIQEFNFPYTMLSKQLRPELKLNK